MVEFYYKYVEVNLWKGKKVYNTISSLSLSSVSPKFMKVFNVYFNIWLTIFNYYIKLRMLKKLKNLMNSVLASA